MHDLPPQSLALYSISPIEMPLDFSHSPLARLSQEEKEFSSQTKHGNAIDDALAFYFLSHIKHTVAQNHHPLARLPKDVDELMSAHQTATNTICKRVFFHILAITMHQVHNYFPGPEEKFSSYVSNRFGDPYEKFLKGRLKNGIIQDTSSLPGTIGDFTGFMVSIFTLAKWPNWAGGKTWAPISALANECAKGAISISELTDQAFSLQHHNGSIFNKGQFYARPDEEKMFHILDIQDSGQIPQWLAQNPNEASPSLRRLVELAKKAFPDEFNKPIDQAKITVSRQKRLAHIKQIKANKGGGGQAPVVPVQSKAAAIIGAQNAILLPPGVKKSP